MSAFARAFQGALLQEYGAREGEDDHLVPGQYDQSDSATAILAEPTIREAMLEDAQAEAFAHVYVAGIRTGLYFTDREMEILESGIARMIREAIERILEP